MTASRPLTAEVTKTDCYETPPAVSLAVAAIPEGEQAAEVAYAPVVGD